MDSERRIFPRRYLENSRQPPTLIGLTADETLEFDRLGRLSPVDHLGNCTWDFESNPKTPNRNGGWNSIENMRLAGVFGLRRKVIGRLLFPIDRHFSIESGLKRWGREDLRSGSRLLPERRANLPDRSWFPSIVSRTFKNALPTGKSISAGERERARFLRRISWARTGDNGGMGLSTWLDFSEMGVWCFS
jgi:hypothetical protein